jgi:hypothetical protein
MRSEFSVKITKCWKCGCDIPVYTWDGHEFWAEICPEDGRPPTLRNDAGYWANYCTKCDALQGDYYLYMEPDGVFFIRENNLAGEV